MPCLYHCKLYKSRSERDSSGRAEAEPEGGSEGLERRRTMVRRSPTRQNKRSEWRRGSPKYLYTSLPNAPLPP
jgi:hypothetical protein